MSIFRSKHTVQQLNLGPPNRDLQSDHSGAAAPPLATPEVDPAKAADVQRRTQQILESGQKPEWVFVCSVDSGLLMFQYAPDKKPALLLFTDPYAARDYIRTTGVSAGVGQIKVESLPEIAQSWVSTGAETFILNRCPRCRHSLLVNLTCLRTKHDFVVYWAGDRAARWMQGEILIRSAFNHMAVDSKGEIPQIRSDRSTVKCVAEARAELEYVRDHISCGIPYLHQLIGFIASMQQDEAAKVYAAERLKEFGPQFEETTEFSPQALSVAIVGLMMNFGMLAGLPGPASPAPNSNASKE